MASEFQKYLAAQDAQQQAGLRHQDTTDALARHAAQVRHWQELVDKGLMKPGNVPTEWADRTGNLLFNRYKASGDEWDQAKAHTTDASARAALEGSRNSGCAVVLVSLGAALAGGIFGINRAMADTPSAPEIKIPTATERSVTDPSVGLQPPTQLFDAKNPSNVAPRPNIVPLKH